MHRALAAAALLLAAIVPPLLLADFMLFRLTSALVWAIALLGFVVLSGLAGQLSFAHAAFYGLGGYTAAILCNQSGLPPYLALPLAAAGGLAVGYGVGLVAAGQGLWNQALVTYAVGIAFPQLVRWQPIERFTGGTQGLYLPVIEVPPGLGFSTDHWWYLVTLFVLVLGIAIVRNIAAGRTGRALMASRDDELAAWAQGIDVRHVRAMAFAVAGGFAAAAGALGALQLNYVGVGTYSFWLSVQFVVGIVVGGMNSVAGALVGGLFLQFFPDVAAAWGRYLSVVLYGAILIAAIVAMPNGMVGLAERLVAWRARRSRSRAPGS